MSRHRGRLLAVAVAASALFGACAKEDRHPPFASGTCAQPPCMSATYHGGPSTDAGVTVRVDASDAGADAPG